MMISRLPFVLALAVLLGGCGGLDTSACADRIKQRLVAPATFEILEATEVKPAPLSLTDYRSAMGQTAAEFKGESDKAATDAERIAADSALAYVRKLNIADEYVRDVKKGDDVSRMNIKFQSENKMGVLLEGAASCFLVRTASGSEKIFLVMDE